MTKAQAVLLPDAEQLVGGSWPSGPEYNLWFLTGNFDDLSEQDSAAHRRELIMDAVASMMGTSAFANDRNKALVIHGDQPVDQLIAAGLREGLPRCTLFYSPLLVNQSTLVGGGSAVVHRIAATDVAQRAEQVDLPAVVGHPSVVEPIISCLTGAGAGGFQLPARFAVVHLTRRIGANVLTGWEVAPT